MDPSQLPPPGSPFSSFPHPTDLPASADEFAVIDHEGEPAEGKIDVVSGSSGGSPPQEAAPTLPSSNGINPHTALASGRQAQALSQQPPATEWDSCFATFPTEFRRYQKPFQQMLTGQEGSAFLQAAQEGIPSQVKPELLLTSLRQLQMRNIPVTKERIQELCLLHQTKTLQVQVSEKETKPELGLLRRVWSYIVSWFTGGYSAWKGTKRVEETYQHRLAELAKNAPSRGQTVLRYSGSHDEFFKQGGQRDIQAATDLSAIDPDESVLHLTDSEVCFQKHGSCITQNAEHAQMLYLQHTAEQGRPPAHLEFSTAGMATLHPSPVRLLDPAKILRLQEATKDNPTEAPRSLYVLPYVFEGYIGHIVNIVIDFNNKKVCFFDSKGKTIDQAQSGYPIALRYNLRNELTRIGQTCFGDRWSAEGNLLDNPVKFQNDTHNCGRWVAFHTEIMLQHKTWEEAMSAMSVQTARPDCIEEFGERAGSRLVDPSNGFHERLERMHPAIPLKVETLPPKHTAPTKSPVNQQPPEEDEDYSAV